MARMVQRLGRCDTLGCVNGATFDVFDGHGKPHGAHCTAHARKIVRSLNKDEEARAFLNKGLAEAFPDEFPAAQSPDKDQ